jgi:hypothetical protein
VDQNTAYKTRMDELERQNEILKKKLQEMETQIETYKKLEESEEYCMVNGTIKKD